jgi:hypothetical protein
MNITPPVADGIHVRLYRKGSPGKMTFKMVKQSRIPIANGDAALLTVDGKDFFFGYVFSIKDKGQGVLQEITVYDQLRYFKNKHTYVYSNKTADMVLRMIASDFLLKAGIVEPTGHVIPSRIEDTQTLFDIIQSALDETLLNTGKLYVLFDDAGRLSLRDVESMRVPLLINEDNVEDFEYVRSIARETYNRIRVVVEDSNTGARSVYQAQDSDTINSWGVLQRTEKAGTAIVAKDKALKMLNYFNKETRTLPLKGVKGDTRVRAGCSSMVSIDLGDIIVHDFLVVESAYHFFKDNEHTMDLQMRGGVITG